MPVNSYHPSYNDYKYLYEEIETIIEGEDAVKNAGEKFVPRLTGQNGDEFKKYIKRGTFYNATSKTISVMTGAAMRKKPTIEASEKVKESLNTCTKTGDSFESVVKKQFEQVISYARFGVLVDYDRQKKSPYLSIYNKDCIINWYEENIGGISKLTSLILKEYIQEKDPEDQFEYIDKINYRHLYLDENGYLVVDLYEEQETSDGKKIAFIKETFMPDIKGIRLDYIPFVCFNPDGLGMALSKPPVTDLVKLNIAHWRMSVDYFHGLHYCAIPTPWAAGFDPEKILTIGGTTAWVTEHESGKAGYLEFTGQGLNPVKDCLEWIETLMAIAGTRLIEHSKKTIERAETLRIRSSGDSATLSTIANTAEKGFLKVLEYYSSWYGVTDKISIALNKDFLDIELDSDQLIALLKAVQLGEISQDTFLYNLKIGEILPEGVSVDDEKEKIKEDMAEREGLINRIMESKGINVGQDDNYFSGDYQFENGKGPVSKAVDKDIKEDGK